MITLNEAKKELLELPETIKERAGQIWENTNSIIELKYHINVLESEIKNKINSEVDDKGKSIYSNDEKRKIEFLERTRGDAEYNSQIEELRMLERNVEKGNFHLTSLRDRQMNLRVIYPSLINEKTDETLLKS